MLTPEEVRAVPLFASLSDNEVDRLVRTSADIHLRAGEYAVHEGGERALYAVLSGRIEVVRVQRARRLRLRRRAARPDQPRRCGRGRGQHGDRLRAPVHGAGGPGQALTGAVAPGVDTCVGFGLRASGFGRPDKPTR